MKVNDVVMTLVSGVLRRFLLDRGELPASSLVAMVPVSVHDRSQRPGRNQVSGMFATLQTRIDDPVERLAAIAAANDIAKEHSSAIGATLLQDWSQFAGPAVFGVAMRVYARSNLTESRPVHNLVVSNVPGPQIPLYFPGREVGAMYPLGPIFHGAGLNITVMSLNGSLNVGLISCPDLVPDLWGHGRRLPRRSGRTARPPALRVEGPVGDRLPGNFAEHGSMLGHEGCIIAPIRAHCLVLPAVAALLATSAGCSTVVGGRAVLADPQIGQPVEWGPVPAGRRWGGQALPIPAGAQCGKIAVPVNYDNPDGASATLALVGSRPSATRSARSSSTPAARANPVSRRRPACSTVCPRGAGALRPGRFRSARRRLLDTGAVVQPDADNDEVAGRPAGGLQPQGRGVHRDQDQGVHRTLRGQDGHRVPGQRRHRQRGRDLDALRAAVGDEKLNYLGYSYGTRIGAACRGLPGEGPR